MAADLGFVTHAAERHAHELAIEGACDRLADRGLARSGRSDQRQDRAGALVLGDAALLPELAHRQVLDDPFLDVVETSVVAVEDLARVYRVESLLRALPPRHREQPVQVGADHRGLAALVAHALQPAGLALGLLANLVREVRLGDLLAVVLRDRALVLAQLLADRFELLSQDVLALLLLGALLDVLADPVADLQLGQALALKRQGELEPLDHVDRLEQLDPLLEGGLRGIGGGVGERAGLGDRAHEGRDATVIAAELQDLLDHGAVLPLEVAGFHARRIDVRLLLHLDPETALGVGVGRTRDSAVQADETDGCDAAGQAYPLGDFGHRTDLCILPVVARDQQYAVFLAHVGGDRYVHVREDDDVVKRD